MKPSLSQIEKNILLILFKSNNGLEAFTIFRRLNLPFSTFMKNIFSLEKHEFIRETSEQFYKLTDKGHSIISISPSFTGDKKWKKLPDKYDSEKISVHSYYIPNIKLLDKNFFK
ncbi:winged helix-turn-helix domain-containing protein [Enterobacter cancerogenus]|uniref:winged helix-turn-helix domain-containing protein n=1 Tax=Enterobacter cancerogenus TaxID=69218 RepID=UPI0038093CC7